LTEEERDAILGEILSAKEHRFHSPDVYFCLRCKANRECWTWPEMMKVRKRLDFRLDNRSAIATGCPVCEAEADKPMCPVQPQQRDSSSDSTSEKPSS
jgi:hypothetical protein